MASILLNLILLALGNEKIKHLVNFWLWTKHDPTERLIVRRFHLHTVTYLLLQDLILLCGESPHNRTLTFSMFLWQG